MSKSTLIAVPHSKVSALAQAIKPGMVKACENSDNEISFEFLEAGLLNGNFNLWMAFDGAENTGAVITEVIPTTSRVWVNVVAGYSNSENGHIHNDVFTELEKYARSIGASGVKFVSMRNGYKRLSKEFGYRERFIEYIKVI